jgi:hypothetical protein
MLAFFAYCLVITFQASLVWWSIPVLLTAVVGVIAIIRYRRFRRMKQALHGVTL